MKKYEKKGISLLVLIVTIIIVIIISGTIILTLTNNEVLDSAKKARFMSDFTNVQDGVNLYSLGKYSATTTEFELPLKGYLTAQDKIYITDNVPTLKTKIEELSGSIDTTNLAWISSQDIGARLSREKAEKGYIIDVDNGQIYDYIGDVFEGKRWHTLDGGVVIGETLPSTYEELWDGWIKLTLYYPSGSTEKKWRLGTEGELRVDPMLMWQNYTGPITIPLDRIQDVWIKYILDGKEVTIPPAGTLLVDIVPDKTSATNVAQVNSNMNAYATNITQVKVHIAYDETATTKEYRIGDSGWITYNGEFNVTENCIIEARAKKTETIYNTDGSVLTTRNIAGRDLVYIGNIGIEETELPAPTITRLSPIGTEKARVQVVYPAEADKKIYKVNYGIEENYTTEINVESYGTYIIAYYYDATGKRSKASSIRINDTSTGTLPEGAESYEPNPPYDPGNPQPVITESYIIAPTVSVTPTSLAEEVQVSINAPVNADKIYIKLGRYGSYQLYTSPVTVRENIDVYAYYRTYAGERSDTGYGVVSNIKKNNKPYVYIDANPYPWSWSYGASEVIVTINYSDTTSIEYSEDGIVYVPYTTPFVVTENKRIYARGTNAYGVTETSLNITNIGKLTPPTPINNLSVGINVNPEPALSTTKVATANVTIDYDSEATEKYYSIGKYGTFVSYTGAFEVTSNCTIYAYAKGVNAEGSASKTIDNLSSGIAEPVIISTPGNNTQASKVTIDIIYDKYATIKRYSIDGTTLRDYTGAFEVTKNGSVIYAYSENSIGQMSEASYIIENIVPEPPTLLLDKGQYYILKLNYPETSNNREYKWKVDGSWTGYKDAGILLLKPQFKDSLIQNGTLVKIEDENGNLVTFTGDYYFIDVPISELFENLFMRWDRVPLGAPQIVITPIEPALQVTANIVYNPNLIKKQYKVVNPDGSVNKDWSDYTGPITIDRNNTVIYAKGMDDTEVWTAEVIQKVTNIDETPPVIKLTADLDTAQQKVAIKVNVTDDVLVGKVKWAVGIQGESYFTTNGTEISNDSIVNITSNGYYTFYGEDQVGNKQVYTLNVTNVDLTAPSIDISVSPEDTVGLSTNITINYGDSTTKQYKVGTSNANWSTYTSTFSISSYTILSNNWQNADGTVTIYAKGKDTAGNEVTVQKKVVSLDLDKPDTPIINSNSEYALLASYGVKLDATTTITYDSRTDIDNYYSIDGGVTWLPYAGQFNMASGTIIAKSVKKSTGLEVVVSKTVAMPADAIKAVAYDNNVSTYDMVSVANSYTVETKYIRVDNSMKGKAVRIMISGGSVYGYGYAITVNFLTSDKTVISSINTISLTDNVYNIPSNTEWISVYGIGGGKLYEIEPSNEPTFSSTNGYMLLHADIAKAIKSSYQMVTINYFPTSVQRLYRIGTTGDWSNYSDQPLKVDSGSTIYAKGIDSYGNETRIVASYTSNIADGIKAAAYDNNISTYDTVSVANSYTAETKYMQVDSSMKGKAARIMFSGGSVYGSGYAITVNFLTSNKTVISSISTISLLDSVYNIPSNTEWISITGIGGGKLYEIEPSNEPTFSSTNGYMLLHADIAKAIKSSYQMVTINYFPTSVQRLYKIGNTDNWSNYSDQPLKVNNGSTIYAKGIDSYGNETRIVASYTSNNVDGIKAAAYDDDVSTYDTVSVAHSYTEEIKYMKVDISMQGKSIKIIWAGGSVYGYGYPITIRFMDVNKTVISTISTTSYVDTTYNVPLNTEWISVSGIGGGRLHEIKPN